MVEEKKSSFYEKLKKVIGILVILGIVIIPALAEVDPNNNYKDTYGYGSDIEVILNAEEYYMLTFEDIHEIYGQPKGTGSARNMYDMGEYTLFFGYEHGYVSRISYMPNEPFKYRRSSEDAFYLFGLEDDIDLFYQDEYNIYRDKDDNYVDCLILSDMDARKKTAVHVTIYFKENLPDRKVFEGDFTDTEVIFDMAKFIDKDRNYVIENIGENILNNIGEKSTNTDYENIIYYTGIGKHRYAIISDIDKVYHVGITLREPKQYKESSQEAMVMFGVNPRLKGLYLDDYYYSDDGYANFESYKSFNDIGLQIIIGDIDIRNKTFKSVAIYMD